MARLFRFSFLCDSNERQLIEKLASHMQRSQSDAVRFTVVNAARELDAQKKTETIAPLLIRDRRPVEQELTIDLAGKTNL